MNVLVVDVGGTSVKMLATNAEKSRDFSSDSSLVPLSMVERVKLATKDWNYEAITLGYPGFVGHDGPEEEPGNLGAGWVGFDFESAFGKPVRVVNDAVLQALGGYSGGRMLFLGLGTGLGSALVCDRVVVPLELGGIRVNENEILFDRLGKQGLEENGEDLWKRHAIEAVEMLRYAMKADYVVLGGGNAARFESEELPEDVRIGGNDDAFEGGFRVWEEDVEAHSDQDCRHWRVVR